MRSRTAWCGRSRASSTHGQPIGAVTRVIVTAAGERAFSAGGDIRALYDLGQAGRQDEALDLLARRIHAQRRDQALSEALRVADRRHRDGRRLRRIGARLASRRRRPLPVRDAGGRHRLLPRRWRHMVAAAHAGRDRRLLRADRRAHEDGRWGRRRNSDPSRAVGSAFPISLEALCGTVSVDAVLAAFAEPRGEGALTVRRAPSTGCSPAIASRIS